jgi:hypothetical protein
VGPRADLDTEARGKILCPFWGSNPDHPVIQPVVRHPYYFYRTYIPSTKEKNELKQSHWLTAQTMDGFTQISKTGQHFMILK